ncbi:MAG TPA: site-specific DNA-methyltransferase [Pyrinomonadaceae bacterium]|jgi:site-specific DNA-methyltransferase (cytosine-N4-specific)
MKASLSDLKPFYTTENGKAYLGDSLELLKTIDGGSIDLICTSPPFALLRKKSYGNVEAQEYVEWFLQFAREFKRIIKPEGSIVIDIGGTWIKGQPVRSLYHFELVLKLCKPESEGGCGLNLAQELFWYNPAKLPTPAEWVTVRRVRVKDAVNTVWWLSPSPNPKASNRRVLKRYSDSQLQLMKNGYKAKLRPSEHQISTKFNVDNGGAIPSNLIADTDYENSIGEPVNLISASNTSSNDIYQRRCREEGIMPHPARFPHALPEFIINLCTEEGDTVLDPFAGSNTTGAVAERLNRKWIALELNEDYLRGSKFRFPELDPKQRELKIENAGDTPENGNKQANQQDLFSITTNGN